MEIRIKYHKFRTHNYLTDGAGVDWYENGRKVYEVNYVHGKKEGKETMWYGNGRKQCEIHYVHGKKLGKEIWWSENDDVKKIIFYVNDIELVSIER
jgi:antitoxin component YwqK of YwqJK toxin-antitoxin module